MDIASFASHLQQALTLTLILSMPTVLAVAAVGLVVALLQAVTQIQDSSIGYGVKLVTGAIVLVLTSGWAGGALLAFVDGLFAEIGKL